MSNAARHKPVPENLVRTLALFAAACLPFAALTIDPQSKIQNLGDPAGGESKIGSKSKIPRTANRQLPTANSFESTALPLLKKYCVPCHSGATAPAKLHLDLYKKEADVLAFRSVFDKVTVKLNEGLMPPPGALQPSAKERQAMLAAILQIMAKAPPPPIDPGRPTLRRLNRAEYDNTVRDLFGIDFQPAADFPSDDVGYGFDNIGDVLSVSPLLMEKYLDAAEQIAAKVIQLPPNKTRTFDAANLQTDTGNVGNENAIVLFTNGRAFVEPTLELPGDYKVKVVAWAQQAGPDVAKMVLRIDGKDQTTFEVRAAPGQPGIYEIPPVNLPSGKHRFAAAFINDYYNPNDPNPRNRDRNLFVSTIEVTGPLGVVGPLPEAHRRLMVATPDASNPIPASRTILASFLKRAFRRPVTKVEVERYCGFVSMAQKEGQPFEQGIRLAVQAALISPHFLFRVELDQTNRSDRTDPFNPKSKTRPERSREIQNLSRAQPRDPKSTRPLTAHELASRLSYFLWSSMPDTRLFYLANNRELLKPEVLKTEVQRMLRDSKAKALTENFAAQWLTLRRLDRASPDPQLFPEWSEELRADMRTETELFFESIVKEDRSVLDFITANYTFVNEKLASFYGITGVSGSQFRKITLPDSKRAGVLSQASLMTLTSNPNRTSPVKRGKWILENILGTPPPPPPPGLDNLEGDKEKVPTKSIKERMAAHRAKTECAVCHARMDPIGFALENFDAVGKWRTKDGPFAVDASDTLPEGTKINGPEGLRSLLLKRKDDFVRTLSEKMLTYAVGRGLEAKDKPSVDRIATQTAKANDRFSALLTSVVMSEPFRNRRVGR